MFVLRSNKVIAAHVAGATEHALLLDRAIVLEESLELRDKKPSLAVRPKHVFPPSPVHVLHRHAVDVETPLTGDLFDLYKRFWAAADAEAKKQEPAAPEAVKTETPTDKDPDVTGPQG